MTFGLIRPVHYSRGLHLLDGCESDDTPGVIATFDIELWDAAQKAELDVFRNKNLR
jgi:hypothetical protein